MSIFSIIFAILMFSFLIFIHEFGHFTAAKLSGVQVNEFSIFMGPAIWKKQIGETLYCLRCIPIGGYCAMEGEDGDSDNPRAFGAAKWWKRLIILVAGAAMNFISGVVLLAIFFAPNEQFVMPVISQAEPGCSVVSETGLQVGDTILELDGEKIYVASDFNMLLTLKPAETHDLLVKRNGEKILIEDLPMERHEFPNPDGTTGLRFGFNFSVAEATFGETMKDVWNTAVDTVRMVRLSLQMLFTGQAGLKDVGGPVAIVQQMTQVAESSGSFYYAVMNLVYFGAFIAINLAVMNLLPIPALDGGRVVCLLVTTAVEAITKKKIDPKYEGWLNGAGMVLLLGLMGVVMFKDIIFLFK